MYKEAEDKINEGLIELSEEVLYMKGNVQNMAQMFLTADDSDIPAQAKLILDEAKQYLRLDCWSW